MSWYASATLVTGLQAHEQWINYILRYLLTSKKLVKPRLAKVETRVPGSPIRTRRVAIMRNAPVKDAIDPRTVMSCDMLKCMEGMFKDSLTGGRGAKKFASARDVWKYGLSKGWVV